MASCKYAHSHRDNNRDTTRTVLYYFTIGDIRTLPTLIKATCTNTVQNILSDKM